MMNMKKLLAAVLALTLVLAAGNALAEKTVTSRDELVQALNEGETEIILSDFTHTGNWSIVTVKDGVTIDGQNSTLTINVGNARPGNCLFRGNAYTIKNLKIVYNNEQTVPNGIEAKGGVFENVTIEGKINHGIFSSGNDTTVKNCTFDTKLYGIYTESANGFGMVTDNTFDSPRAALLQGDEKFINNTVNGDKGLSVKTNQAEIVSNTFTGERAISISKDGVEIYGNKFLGDSCIEIDKGLSADMTGNYWGGDAPAASRLKPEDNTASINIGGWFSDLAMKNFVDPNAVVGGADMPSTGDSSMLMLWAALLALCAGAAVAMKRVKA